MRRREFIAGLGSAAAWPMVARAQQAKGARRVGVLMVNDEADPTERGQAVLSGFTKRLAELGWTDGRNLRIDVRWAGNDLSRIPVFAKEQVSLQPDVILAVASTPAAAALQRETRTIPIVFVGISDPVASGLIASLREPGGNLTGFFNWEASFAGKWLELRMEIAPDLKRVAMIFNPETAPLSGSYFLPSFEAAARSRKVEPIAAPVHSDIEIATAMTSLGREPRGGLVVMPDGFTGVHRVPIILLAARNNVPAVYQTSAFVREGGLLSYGPDGADLFRRSASYVDRIFHGEKPGDLPVQAPVKFDMAVNIKTAKSLGLTVPQSILLSADEVIE